MSKHVGKRDQSMIGQLFDASRLPRRWLLLIVTLMLSVVLFLYYEYKEQSHTVQQANPSSALGSDVHVPGHDHGLVKPQGIKIIGLVFFGRKDRVQILKCFLERNLVEHGGWLDEVHWIRNTGIEHDVKYLHELVASNAAYKEVEIKETGFVGYGIAWTTIQPGAIYVKIDDDVVWVADDTIPRIVTTKLDHPEYLTVTANMINSPLMGWVHYHMGALKPYLPELINPEDVPPSLAPDKHKRPPAPKRVPWRYTSHPMWTGPEDHLFSFNEETPSLQHRWLRLPTDHDNMVRQLHRTPISDSEYRTWGNSLHSWAIAAQQHYSFLENLCDDTLDLYKFAAPGAAWLTDYQRVSINLIAINSTEILQHLPMDTVDEEWLTVALPKRIQKSVAVDTHALAVHFSFGTQGEVATTDLLGRYLDYAQEYACLKAKPESYWK